jgi:hypothetical protein
MSEDVSWEEMGRRAIAALPEDVLGRSVVYLDRVVVPAEQPIKLGEREEAFPWRSVVCFVDLGPGQNWGHESKYVVLSAESEETRVFDAHFPPFLRGAAETLRVIWKAPSVPDWTVAT